MPSKFLAKNPLKILSENRIMSCISTTCNFLIPVLFPCRHGTHSASRKSTRVSEYQSNISLFHFSFAGPPFLILYIIIYNIIIYTYKLLLSYCHFENRKCYFGTLVLYVIFVIACTVLGTRIVATEHVSATVQHFENDFCRLVVQGTVL